MTLTLLFPVECVDMGTHPVQVRTPGGLWRRLCPRHSVLQWAPCLEEWAWWGWSSAAAGNQPNTHFFPDGYHEGYQDSYRDAYHDGYVPHVFCSPTTPGPSPHYPQTHSLSSPAPHIHPINENLGFHRETSTQLIPDQTFHRCPLTSEAPQHLLHQTSQHLLLNQADLIQDQTDVFDPSFSPQAGGQSVSGAAQGPSLAAGLMWSDKPGGGGAGEGGGRGRGGRGGRGGGGGGGGRGRRGRGGGGGGRGRGRGRGGGGGGGGGGGRGGGGGGGGEAQPQSVVFSSCNMKSSQPENNTKVLDNRLLCTVCKRDFRSLPALNGHMRSHSCSKKGEVPPVRRSVSVVMPVSVPVQSRAASKACRAGQRRSSRSSPATGGAVLYRSLMHLEEQEVVTRGSAAAREVEGHYTPPPMLCPVRAGPGLYCSVTTRRQRRAPTVQLHSSNNGLSDLVAMETPATEINKPRINVGRGFQAEVPPLGNHKYAHSDSQNALWLWTPCDELEKPVNQQRVTTLLTMARSSVVPGGGASPEYALTVLSESAGDFLLTLEKLLSTPESSDQSRADVTWSAAETTALVKSLRLHRKDFSRVQRAVQTKSVSQCVEFYYLWKKHLSLRARPPAGLTVTLPETKVRSSSDHGDERDPERPSAPDRRR
ncbi:uncharacterized protein LOC128430940 isoform X2 [Pleuronectes platessa]|uniref:uncharacterized protein LOC128430940 isoform X2 n=1 Tax=Pleuronectes platessa TaxID=8262 RepID=UPI00232A27D1|nr:uncharacterized protein LOC128430940 isoform X2 [Pleuronectes platessa]